MIIVGCDDMANDFMTFQFDEDWFTPKEDNKQIMTVEDYLAMDYDTLKEHIYRNPDTQRSVFLPPYCTHLPATALIR